MSCPPSTACSETRTWDTALVVAHGAVNRAILSHALLGERLFLGRFEQAPGCLNVLDVGSESPPEWIVRAVNVAPRRPGPPRHATDPDGAVLVGVRPEPRAGRGARHRIAPLGNEGEGDVRPLPVIGRPRRQCRCYVDLAVSHLSFDTGWNVPFVNLMILSH